MTVAVLSGESGAATLQETIRRIRAARQIELASLGKRLVWQFHLANTQHLAALGAGLGGPAYRWC